MTYAREMLYGRNFEMSQLGLVSDARLHEYLRSIDMTTRMNKG
jgi:hypothetical protein